MIRAYMGISSKCFLLKCMPDVSVTCPVCKRDWRRGYSGVCVSGRVGPSAGVCAVTC